MKTRTTPSGTIVPTCFREPGPIDTGHNAVCQCSCADCRAERDALTAQRDLFAQPARVGGEEAA